MAPSVEKLFLRRASAATALKTFVVRRHGHRHRRLRRRKRRNPRRSSTSISSSSSSGSGSSSRSSIKKNMKERSELDSIHGYNHSENSRMTMFEVLCVSCSEPILDKFVTRVLDKPWHESCVRCADCGVLLDEKCFAKNERIFCKDDFYRRYGPRCSGCQEVISPTDMVRKARDRVFHLNCFTCFVCRKQLLTGEKLYVLGDGSFVCKDDYLSGNLSQNSVEYDVDDVDEDEFDDDTKDFAGRDHHSSNVDSEDDDGDGKSKKEKRRGPRTTIKAKQLEILKATFSQTPKPTRHVREELAKETGLPMRVIQVWFQNRRSKERRLKQMSNRTHKFFGRKIRVGGGGLDYYYDSASANYPPNLQFPRGDFYPSGFPGLMDQQRLYSNDPSTTIEEGMEIESNNNMSEKLTNDDTFLHQS